MYMTVRVISRLEIPFLGQTRPNKTIIFIITSASTLFT